MLDRKNPDDNIIFKRSDLSRWGKEGAAKRWSHVHPDGSMKSIEEIAEIERKKEIAVRTMRAGLRKREPKSS